MKKTLLLALLVALPMFAQAADVNVNLGGTRIQSGNTTITFGDRDKRDRAASAPIFSDRSRG